MKTISTRELRQNPSRMIRDVEAGEVYALTLRGRRVGTIVPARDAAGGGPAEAHGSRRSVGFRAA